MSEKQKLICPFKNDEHVCIEDRCALWVNDMCSFRVLGGYINLKWAGY
jgi:hypothetical protein